MSTGKTATHHYGYFKNLKHNNRERISENVDTSRLDKNVYLVTAGAPVLDSNGNPIVLNKETGEVQRYATIEEIYDKVFEPTWQEFQKRQRKCRRTTMTYYEWVQEKYKKEAAKVTGTNKTNKAAKPVIELYSQIGNIEDTGWEVNPDDASKAKKAILAYQQDFLARSYVCTVTNKELYNPDWAPPFDAGFIVVNDVLHGDEATSHSQLNVIPYYALNKTGNNRGIALQKVAEGLGYKTELVYALDENGEKIKYKNKDGEYEKLKDGSDRYLKIKKAKGFADFLEDERNKLIEYGKEYGWIRKKSPIKRKSQKHENTNDYVIEKQRTVLNELEKKSYAAEEKNNELTKKNNKLLEDIEANQKKLTDFEDISQQLTETKAELKELQSQTKKQQEQIDSNKQVLQNQQQEINANTDQINKQVELFNNNQVMLDKQQTDLEEHKGILDAVYTLLEYFNPLERLIELLSVLKKHKNEFFGITDDILENEDYMDYKEKDALDYAWQVFSDNQFAKHSLLDLLESAKKLKEQEDKLRKSTAFRSKDYDREI